MAAAGIHRLTCAAIDSFWFEGADVPDPQKPTDAGQPVPPAEADATAASGDKSDIEAATAAVRSTPVAKPTSAAEPATVSLAEPATVSLAKPAAEPKSAAPPEPVAEPKPAADPKPVAQPKPAAEPEVGAKPEAAAGAAADPTVVNAPVAAD